MKHASKSTAATECGEHPNPDPLYDAAGAAAYLGLEGVVKHPAQAVRSLCRKRRLPSTRVAGKVMVRRSWLEAYLEQNTRPVAVGLIPCKSRFLAIVGGCRGVAREVARFPLALGHPGGMLVGV